MVRQFYLQNQAGAILDLMSESHFLHRPQGLGFGIDATYERPADGFFAEVDSRSEQINPVGEIVFLGATPYQDYEAFVNWVCAASSIKLVSKPYGTTGRACDVSVEFLQKAEIQDGYLRCPVSFRGKTPWYNTSPTVLNFALNDDVDYKIYSYTYPYVYSKASASNKVVHTAAGHYPAAVRLTAFGEMVSPAVTLKRAQDGEILGKLYLEGLEVEADEHLLFSTVPGSRGVWVVGADGTSTDVSSYMDLTYDSFFRLPLGVECEVVLEFTGSADTATLYVYDYYRHG